MHRKFFKSAVSLALIVIFGSSFAGVYGVKSSDPSQQVDAIASATKAAPVPTPAPAPITAPKSVPKTVTQPPKTVDSPVDTQSTLMAVPVSIDDVTLNLGDSPALKTPGGQVMLPLRGVWQYLGYTVSWDNGTKSAMLQNGLDQLVVKKDSADALHNGRYRTLGQKVELVGGRLYAPLALLESSPDIMVSTTAGAVTIKHTAVQPTGVSGGKDKEREIEHDGNREKERENDDDDDDDD